MADPFDKLKGKEGMKVAPGIRFIKMYDLPPIMPAPIRQVVLSVEGLETAYTKMMEYQPREATVVGFAKYKGNGLYRIVRIMDITPEDTSEYGIDNANVSFGLEERLSKEERYFVAQFHSHPSGCDMVSSRDLKCAERHKNSKLYASFTPEGVICFFGFPNYKIVGEIEKIKTNKYQLDLDNVKKDIRVQASKIKFKPLSEKDKSELRIRKIKFESIE